MASDGAFANYPSSPFVSPASPVENQCSDSSGTRVELRCPKFWLVFLPLHSSFSFVSTAAPLAGPDITVKPGAALAPFAALPFPQSAPGPPAQPPWGLPSRAPAPLAFSPGNPLVLSAFPSPLLVTGDGGPGPSGAGAGAGKVIVKVKTEAGPAESSQTQNFILTQTALNWIASGAPCGGPEGPAPGFLTASNVKTLLPAQAVGVTPEGLPGLPAQAPPPAAQLAPTAPPEKAWPGPHGAPEEGGPAAARSQPSLGDLSYASKGVYENFRRWQHYKALARRHLPQSPDAEALSCFLIPVLRSLARRRPTMTLEEGLPRAVQEWERTSNFDRMTFYEMAEKFMEFETEEEMQIQNTQLMNGLQGLPPAAPLKPDPPGPLAPEVCQQPVYIPKKAASKARAPRRRQRKTQRPPAPEAPKEIPAEAVKEYSDIMEELVASHLATEESDGKQEEEEEQQQEEGLYPDAGLLSYIDELCSQEVFVSKVEAVIHPQFLADLLSPEQQRDPLALTEELEQEEGLSLAQLVQKRLLALEEEDAEAPPSCSGAQLDSSPSVSDEDEEGGGRLRPSPGPWVAGGTICLGKAASPGKQAREVPGGQERALGGPRWLCRDGNPLPSASGWDLQLELAAPQGTRGPLGMERRGSGKVTGQISSHVDDHLGGAGSPGRSLVADRASEALPLCWQEGPQLEIVPHLDVGLSELTPLQGQGLGKQALGMQTGQQIGNLGAAPQEEPLAVPQEGSPGAMWGDDRGPPTVQSYDQDPSPRAAGDRDGAGASLSPGLWLSNVIDTVGLELPLQIEEVIESFHDGECVTEHQRGCQASGTRSSISLGPGETTALEGMGSSAVPCGSTDATLALEKTNYCSLSGPLRANSSASQPKLNRGQSPETIRDPSDLWAGVCPPLLESRIDASTRGASKEAPLPAGQGNILILGPQGTSSFPEASPEAGGRDSSISPLVEATKCGNTLSVRDACGLQLGAAEDTCPLGFHPYDPQGEAREDTDLSEPKDLASLPASRESYAHRTPKSTPPLQGLRSTSPRRGTRDALVVREAPPVSGTGSSADGAKGEEEDEELSNFVYLLASKLSLSPRRGHGSASGLLSGGRRGQRAPPSPTPEARGLSQPPNPVAKSGKQAVVGGPAPAEKKPFLGADLGAPGEKPLALGAVRASQPRKRRRDSFVTGRRKKRRRSQ
ncbi:NUT family member 1 [Camelus ferus]|uniref:NUT family member 1 n=1 Tax=Camelus ferus TaxID=419612 RepID=A0A8B8T946_CAMFR|nr:NUT family member 1 [Camelus ferus]